MNLLGLYSQKEVIVPIRNRKNASPTKEKFTGKERDSETGLDYFGARYYDSSIGRWLAVDPLAEKYPAWSPYNYTLNNPVNVIDPNGMEAADPGDFYASDGTYIGNDGKNDQQVYIYKQGRSGEMVTTDVATLKALTIVTHSETTSLASWGQKTGIAETVRNRANVSDRTIYETATNANEYKGPANARGQAISAKLAGYSGGTDIGLSLSDEQARSAKSAIAALRGSNAAGGATGFDGYNDLKGDFIAVGTGKDPKDKGELRRGRGYDRPFRGMDASGIVDPQFAIGSTQNIESPGSPQTYILTKVVWDNKKAGVSGTVFYKTHPNSGLRY